MRVREEGLRVRDESVIGVCEVSRRGKGREVLDRVRRIGGEGGACHVEGLREKLRGNAQNEAGVCNQVVGHGGGQSIRCILWKVCGHVARDALGVAQRRPKMGVRYRRSRACGICDGRVEPRRGH
eukprot:5618047-Pleurochrysis_carterae.AAC.1